MRGLAFLAGLFRFSSYVCVYVMSSMITENPAGYEGEIAVWWLLGAVVLGCAASATSEIVFIDKWEEKKGRHT